VEERFTTDILPMIKTSHRDGRPHEEGIACMIDALEKRVEIPRVFESQDLARELVRKSGGCIRDLMHLCQEAFLGAGEFVTQSGVERAVETVRSEFSRKIKTSHYPLLANIHLRRSIANDPDHRELLFRRDVLEYNYDEERWADVHPLVQGMREYKRALEEEKGERGAASTP